MSASQTNLNTAVANLETEIVAVIAYLQGLPALIAAAGTDQAALDALTAKITADTASLASGLAAAPPEPVANSATSS